MHNDSKWKHGMQGIAVTDEDSSNLGKMYLNQQYFDASY